MNNNKLDEPALLAGCRGVFSKTSYITIGAKENPEEYVKKLPPRSAFAGKHFSTVPPKDGKTVDVYFEKAHPWLSQGDKYNDNLKYKDIQTEKKKGFLTSDFRKRDEFTNTIRTEQWRELLKAEDTHNRKALHAISASMEHAGLMDTSSTSRRNEDGELLYDLVFEKDDPTFSGASKTHRDTKNKTQLTRDRTLGEKMTTMTLTYQAPAEFNKPEYAHRPLVRDTFYRKTNIMFPAGCSAEPSV